MSRLLQRDPLADVETLVRRVYGYVAYHVGDGPDAEDTTSDVFERALRYRSSYDRSKGEPVAWLLGIARRCVAETVAARTESRPQAIEEQAHGNLEEDTIRHFAIVHALSRLSERERELIALRFGADLTARQIAAVVGERTNTVEVALHRALERLRPLLEDRPASRPEPRLTTV